MKSILLFRHGKSEWNTYYDSDHNRPLAPRGIKAAKKMGLFLANKKQIPDIVISSTAMRARTTFELDIKEGRENYIPCLYKEKIIVPLQLIRQQYLC